MSKILLPATIKKTLDGFRRRRRFISVITGMFAAFAICIAGLTVAILADRFFRLQTGARFVALGSIGVVVLYSIARWILVPLVLRMSDRRAAVRLGDQFPDAEEDLVTAVELTRDTHRMPGVSESLIASALESISERATKLNVRLAVSVRPMLELLGVFVVVALILGGLYALRPEAIQNAFARILRPDKNVDFFSYVRPRVAPGEQELVIAKGDSVSIWARLDAPYAVDSARLNARLVDGTGAILSASRSDLEAEVDRGQWLYDPLFVKNPSFRKILGGGTGDGANSEWLFDAVFGSKELRDKSKAAMPGFFGSGRRDIVKWKSGALFNDLNYRLRAGDGRSPDNGWHKVRVVEAPRLVERSAIIKLPSYAGENRTEPIEDFAGTVEIIKGSQLEIAALPADRGDDEKFRCSGSVSIEGATTMMGERKDGWLVSSFFEPKDSGDLTIQLMDQYKLSNRAPESVYVRLIDDKKPQVSSNVPGRDFFVMEGGRVLVEAYAKDDIGLRGLDLQKRVIKGRAEDGAGEPSWLRHEIKEGGRQETILKGATTISVEAEGLVAGDMLEYRAQAADYAGPGNIRAAYSAVYRIHVLSEMDHLAMIMEQLRDVQMELMKGSAGQETQADRAGDMANKAGEQDMAAAAEQARKREAQQRKKIQEAADKVDELTPQLAANPSATPETLEEMERLAREIRSVAEEAMKKAQEEFAKAAEAGKPSEGKPSEGKPSEGKPSEGKPSEGKPSEGKPSEGKPSEGKPSEGKPSEGKPSEGKPSEGKPSEGKPSEGKPSEGKDAAEKAKEAAEKAAKQLKQLAEEAGRIQRQSILEKLAADAMRLAESQRDIGNDTPRVARMTLGRSANNLTFDQKEALSRLALAEMGIENGVDELIRNIEKTAQTLAFSNGRDAATAEEAGTLLKDDRIYERTIAIRKKIIRNVLFAQSMEQLKVANVLEETSKILSRETGSTDLDKVEKRLEQFIKRQKAINEYIGKTIADEPKAPKPGQLGEVQADLRRDVSEQASALTWLAREIEMSESETALKLEAAAAEMGEGSEDLYASRVPEGLVHGEKALALLETAREEFKEEKKEMEKKKEEKKKEEEQDMRLTLLLYRMLANQNRVKDDSVNADRLRHERRRRFNRMSVVLAGRESAIRRDCREFAKILAEEKPRDAAMFEALLGGKMDLVRLALAGGDTGTHSRQVQGQIIAYLEKLIKEQEGGGEGEGEGQGQGQSRASAIGKAMGQTPGMQGSRAGENDITRLPTDGKMQEDESWTKVRKRFDKAITSARDSNYPSEMRPLVNAYFDRLRKDYLSE
jgi:hypothetical protein